MFTGYTGEITTMLFAIADNVVPNWFGVAVPHGLTDVTRAHIFFHPTPGQANYMDADYPTKSGKWPELFYYMERLGYQLDGAHRGQVLIMPFLTEARKDAGILPANWQDIVLQILTQVRAQLNPSDQSPLTISQLAVSSFSAGMIYSYWFCSLAPGLDGVLAEIWDFDGHFSTYRWITEALHSAPGREVIKYDQLASSDTRAYHVPIGRWQSLPNPPAANGDVHALIRDFMFLDAASVSAVGGQISDVPVPTTGTHTATHAVTATHTGTATRSWGTSSGSDSATHTLTHTLSRTGSQTQTSGGRHTAYGSHSATGSHTITASHTTEPPSTLTVSPSPAIPTPSPAPQTPLSPLSTPSAPRAPAPAAQPQPTPQSPVAGPAGPGGPMTPTPDQ